LDVNYLKKTIVFEGDDAARRPLAGAVPVIVHSLNDGVPIIHSSCCDL
jgi:hypothetical protein